MPANYVTVHQDGTITREPITGPITYASLHPAAVMPCPRRDAVDGKHYWVDVGAGQFSCPCGAQRTQPLCGDPTCEGLGCTQEAIDAYYARQEEAARVDVRTMLGLPNKGGDA